MPQLGADPPSRTPDSEARRNDDDIAAEAIAGVLLRMFMVGLCVAAVAWFMWPLGCNELRDRAAETGSKAYSAEEFGRAKERLNSLESMISSRCN